MAKDSQQRKPERNTSKKTGKTGISIPAIDLKNNKLHQNIFAGILLTILVLITYWGAGKNQFVDWDDNEYVIDNPLVRSTGTVPVKDIFSTVVSLNYHPLTILSLRASSNVCKSCPYGISPRPFIHGNILLHILNSLLVLILIYRLSNGDILISFLVASLFGVHPMHVESVAWISGRKDLLYSFFFLAGLLTYIRFLKALKNRYIWLAVTFILFVFSCLSKATAVVFPVVALLINFWFAQTEGQKPGIKALKNALSAKNLLFLFPFFLVSVFVGLMAARIQGGQNFLGLLKFIKSPNNAINILDNITVLQKLQVAGYGFMMYIVKFIFPFRLSALYPYPTQQEFSHGYFSIVPWITLVATVLMAFFVIRSLRKEKLYFFGIGFYFVTVALVLQIISVGTTTMAERYTYLPYIGLSFIPATLIVKSRSVRKSFLLGISGCFVIIMMIMARQQVKIWHDSGTLWSQVLDRNPHLVFARGARGKYYYKLSSQTSNKNEIINLENKALADFTDAIKTGTSSAEVYEATGMILGSRGDLKNALLYLNTAVTLDPKEGRTYYNRALINDQSGKKEDAIRDYNMALIYSPGLAVEILSNRSVLFIETGRYKEAVEDLNYLISINNKDDRYYVNRGFARLRQNDISGAIEDYKSALRLNPRDKVTQEQLQVLLDNQLQ